ncbi:GIN domain-containing protein [Parvularcula dongshanensis]|uniref:Auto-transporter adhesin head GIN domain-containing protein n=1 Tax=Parvularcula dongshanensis TaxID=1173995 RepID=A0A840I1U8_9PROT|nr:DUF2807 domain-containing protein [Parvularcula dongshanensis]MBB4658214.1 hypothetical protein [Parvularcula dongshanensis]
MKPLLLTLSVPLALSCAAAVAAQRENVQRFDADTVSIEDAIGTVTVTFDDGEDVRVALSDGNTRPLTVRQDGDRIEIEGPDAIDEDDFWAEHQRYAKGGFGVGPIRIDMGRRTIVREDGEDPAFARLLEDYPVIAIRAPRGTALTVEDSALRLRGEGAAAGALSLGPNTYLVADLGDAQSAAVTLSGVGQIKLGAIEGDAAVDLLGSGDVAFGDAGTARLTLKGSGDIVGGAVNGDARIELQGSGDVTLGAVSGATALSLRGSGDVGVRETGALDVALVGSGDIEVGRVDGAVSVELRGSGDVSLRDGRADPFEATLTGSGDIEFGGTAISPVLRARGSGDIEVAEAEGAVDARGDGIRVAGRRYGDD